MPDQELTNWEGRGYIVNFSDIYPSGRAGGDANGRTALSLGVLPNEQATVRIAKHKKGQLIADVVSIQKESSNRVAAKEDHYAYCSPWQIASYEAQLQYKQDLLKKSFKDVSLNVPAVEPSQHEWGYRTRIEFGVKEIDKNWTLVLHGHNSSIATSHGCLLASEAMNTAALSTMKQLQEVGVPVESIKSIVVREGKTTSELLVAVYVFTDTFPEISETPQGITSLLVIQADPNKLISVPKKILQTIGVPTVTEKLLDLTIQYPFDSFFQNNIPLYEKVLKDIANVVPSVEHIVDIYAGVGIIGLSLNTKAKRITAYEVGSSMVHAARRNSELNSIQNYEVQELSDIDIRESHVRGADVVIVNPTRRGLHEQVVSAISKSRPNYTVYLSCNYQTQARDIAQLGDEYIPIFFNAYDFYPHTPHVESLLVLKRQ